MQTKSIDIETLSWHAARFKRDLQLDVRIHIRQRDNAPDFGTKGPRRGGEAGHVESQRQIVKEISNVVRASPSRPLHAKYAGIVSVMRSLWHCIAIASLTLRAPNIE